VLCSEIPGYLSVVTSGQDALTVAPHSPVEIATGMVILARDPRLRERLGEAGVIKARERYAWPVVTAHLLEVYQEARARASGEPVLDREGWRVHDAHTGVG
jgi:glycosyltransferase involved in cell wall biosynthesis